MVKHPDFLDGGALQSFQTEPWVQPFGDGDGRSGGETQRRIQAVNGTSSMETCQLSEMFSHRVAIYIYV